MDVSESLVKMAETITKEKEILANYVSKELIGVQGSGEAFLATVRSACEGLKNARCAKVLSGFYEAKRKEIDLMTKSLRIAAEQFCPLSLQKLAELQLVGKLVEQQKEKGLENLRKAFLLNNFWAWVVLFDYYSTLPKEDRANHTSFLYRVATELYNSRTKIGSIVPPEWKFLPLAICHKHGYGTEKNVKVAVNILQEALVQGKPSCLLMYKLARCLRNIGEEMMAKRAFENALGNGLLCIQKLYFSSRNQLFYYIVGKILVDEMGNHPNTALGEQKLNDATELDIFTWHENKYSMKADKKLRRIKNDCIRRELEVKVVTDKKVAQSVSKEIPVSTLDDISIDQPLKQRGPFVTFTGSWKGRPTRSLVQLCMKDSANFFPVLAHCLRLKSLSSDKIIQIEEIAANYSINCLFLLMEDDQSLPFLKLPRVIENSIHPPKGRLAILKELINLLILLHDKGLCFGILEPSSILVGEQSNQTFFTNVGIFQKPFIEPAVECYPQFLKAKRLRFIAPELLRDLREMSTASDIWSFGMLAYYVYSQHMPWFDVESADEMRRKFSELDESSIINMHSIRNMSGSGEIAKVQEIIVSSLRFKPSMRLSAREIAQALKSI
eukprot:TRINITY_DN3482_c0_g3_i1.p1 TRINITY_DN3482_c0_g3~~TRINITY_DN3482_c0_g3_i1.p1  ORF type:complete len:611 (-),score=134.72 TRINITY_DN3482_c0_g3_i1:97-1929(-)